MNLSNLELPQRLVTSPKIDQNSVTDQQNDKYNDSGTDPSKLKFWKAIVFVVEWLVICCGTHDNFCQIEELK